MCETDFVARTEEFKALLAELTEDFAKPHPFCGRTVRNSWPVFIKKD